MNPLVEKLVEGNQHLFFPYEPLSAGLIKVTPEDFKVREELAYQPSGTGEHIYLCFRRSDWNTGRISSKISQILEADKHSYGYAGMKDRHALVEQTISVKSALTLEHAREKLMQHASDIEIVAISRHQNKLKRGHLRYNHFQILVKNLKNIKLDAILLRRDSIIQNGFLNYYGDQRFGIDFDNIRNGFDVLKEFKRVKSLHKRKLFINALQAALFNLYLSRRMTDAQELLMGDILKKSDTGGLFIYDNPSDENRVTAGNCTVCGPIFGHKMMASEKATYTMEMALLEEFHLGLNKFRRLKTAGSRRAFKIYPEYINIEMMNSSELSFQFKLPKGVYATTLLKHFFELKNMATMSEKHGNDV